MYIYIYIYMLGDLWGIFRPFRKSSHVYNLHVDLFAGMCVPARWMVWGWWVVGSVPSINFARFFFKRTRLPYFAQQVSACVHPATSNSKGSLHCAFVSGMGGRHVQMPYTLTRADTETAWWTWPCRHSQLPHPSGPHNRTRTGICCGVADITS